MRMAYHSARRGYPVEVFSYLKELTKGSGSKVLDLGCGTGISTRQLKEFNFEVIGTDKDTVMIDMALKLSPDMDYIVALADKLPFNNNEFDVVTAFTAFHWFNNYESLSEIKRILRPEGMFFAALKTNRKDEDQDFKNGYMAILKKYAGNSFDSTNKHYDKTFLIEVGFSDITERSFSFDEKYSVDDALTLIKSLSLWNLVAEGDKLKMLDELKEFYESHLVDGQVVRSREIATITAFRK